MSSKILVSGTLGVVRELKSDKGKGPTWAVSVPIMLPGLSLEFMLSPRDPRDMMLIDQLVGAKPIAGAGSTVDVEGEYRVQMDKPTMFLTAVTVVDDVEHAKRLLAEAEKRKAASAASKPKAA